MNTATVEITKVCPFCGKVNHLIVNEEMYNRWISGESIQRVFPMVNASERELLISGICYDCQDNIFGGDDDE